MSNSKESAPTSVAIADAAKISIEFDAVEAQRILDAMADAQTQGESSKAERDNLSLEFCSLAISTRESNAGIDRDTVAKGFAAELDVLLPRMAVTGSPFVETSTNDKGEVKHAWKGHGANVKSIAKGCAEFYGVEHTDDNGEQFDALIDVEGAESFTAVKKSVEAARRYANETDEARTMRETKETFRNVIKEYAALVIASNDVELIALASETVTELHDEFQSDVETMEALNLEAEVTETVEVDSAALEAIAAS